jgi:hypothetical protein
MSHLTTSDSIRGEGGGLKGFCSDKRKYEKLWRHWRKRREERGGKYKAMSQIVLSFRDIGSQR